MPNSDRAFGPELLTFDRSTQTEMPSHTIGTLVSKYGHLEDLLRYENRDWFISLRWVVIGLLCTGMLIQPLVIPGGLISGDALLVAAAVLFVTNGLFYLHHHLVPEESPRSVLLSLWLQILTDIFVILFLVESMDSCILCLFTPMLFLPHVVLGAVMLRPVHSFLLVSLTNLLYAGFLYTHCMGDVGGQIPFGDHITLQITGSWALLYAIWFLTFRLSSVIRARDTRLSQSHQEVRQTFETSRSQMYHTAHQMKSPVVAIQSLLELYKFENEEDMDPELDKMLYQIGTRCDHLLDSVSDMLFLAKIKARETVNWGSESVFLDCLVRGIVERHLDRMASRSIQLSVTIEPYEYVGDQDALDRLLDNLISNAINYSHAGGTVHVAGKMTEGGYLLDVQDAGIGIKASELEDIFKPHYRTIEAKHHHNVSTGLGLPIVHAAAEFLGLSLSVRSRAGKGSCFSVNFPREPISVELEPALEEAIAGS